jgi:hypothetical protein
MPFFNLYCFKFRANVFDVGRIILWISEVIDMKNIIRLLFVMMLLVFISCNGNSNQSSKKTDTTINNGGPDSAANNGILPPSGSPANANNSSLADTTYKAKDTAAKK